MITYKVYSDEEGSTDDSSDDAIPRPPHMRNLSRAHPKPIDVTDIDGDSEVERNAKLDHASKLINPTSSPRPASPAPAARPDTPLSVTLAQNAMPADIEVAAMPECIHVQPMDAGSSAPAGVVPEPDEHLPEQQGGPENQSIRLSSVEEKTSPPQDDVEDGVEGSVEGSVEGGVEGDIEDEIEDEIEDDVDDSVDDSVDGSVEDVIQDDFEDYVEDDAEDGADDGCEVRAWKRGGDEHEHDLNLSCNSSEESDYDAYAEADFTSMDDDDHWFEGGVVSRSWRSTRLLTRLRR